MFEIVHESTTIYFRPIYGGLTYDMILKIVNFFKNPTPYPEEYEEKYREITCKDYGLDGYEQRIRALKAEYRPFGNGYNFFIETGSWYLGWYGLYIPHTIPSQEEIDWIKHNLIEICSNIELEIVQNIYQDGNMRAKKVL